MRRLSLLAALSFAAIAPAAHAAPVAHGGVTAHAAQAGSLPGDRDADGTPDASDQCPDTPGKDNGCQPFEWRYFFVTQGLKQFLADKPRDTTYCRGLTKCTATHVTFTLSAATAKAAGITNRRIATIAVSVPTMGFDHHLARATKTKLGRLKAITVTIRAWAVLETGQKIEAPSKTLTIRDNQFAAHQFNNLGTTAPEGGL
jgi:hypothetical protein